MNKVFRYSGIAFLFLFFLISTAAIAVLDRKMTFDDDKIYTYTIAQSFAVPERHHKEIEQAHEYLTQYDALDEERELRFNFRSSYYGNYVAQSSIIALVRHFIVDDGFDEKLFNEYLSHISFILAVSNVLLKIIAIVIFFAIFWRVQHKPYVLPAVFCSIAIMFFTFFLDMTGLWDAGPYRFAQTGLTDLFTNLGIYILNPGIDFDVFGVQARSIAALMVFAIFLLRFEKRYALSYALCFGLAFIHLTYALLAVSVFMIIDIALATGALRLFKTRMFITAISVFGMLNMNVWFMTESQLSLFPIIPVILLALSCLTQPIALLRNLFLMGRIKENQTIYAEMGFIWLAVLSATIISFIAGRFLMDDLTHMYTTAELAPRVTGMFRPVLFFSFFYMAFIVMEKTLSFWPFALKTILTFCVAGLVLSGGYLVKIAALEDFHRVEQNYHAVEAYLQGQCDTIMNELTMYSLMACRADGYCQDKPWKKYEQCNEKKNQG